MTTELETLAARARARSAAANDRAEMLRAALPHLATVVRDLGAARVVVFGSVAEGGVHERSDIDLAVTGLPADRYWEALGRLGAEAPCAVDLVREEDASPSLLQAIRRGRVVDAG